MKIKTNLEDNPYMYPLSNDLVLQREEYHRFLFKKNYITLYLINDTNPIRRKSFLPALTGFEAENGGKILILKIAWQCGNQFLHSVCNTHHYFLISIRRELGILFHTDIFLSIV